MTELARTLTAAAWTALGGEVEAIEALSFSGEGALSSAYATSDLAAASVAAAGLAIARLVADGGAPMPRVDVDRRLASLWFAGSVRPLGWSPPPLWDPIAGDYRASDGWIRLHTNAPRHRAAAQAVLGPHDDRAAMGAAVAGWAAEALETAIVAAGGCAAQMRSVAAWADHPQGRAVAREPLAATSLTDAAPASSWTPSAERPLAGLKVLDLTRILAGPTGTRVLAGYGAAVLRIDPPGWEEPVLAPEVTLGKRCARLDLHDPADRAVFATLLGEADILVHGYRPGALEGLGYGDDVRRTLSPGLIEVSLCAYGWTGPWAGRRGFDSLVQMSAGIAEGGMAWKGAGAPTPLPVQALDFATGYLIAAAAVRGLSRRLKDGMGSRTRLSLARTAKFLVEAGRGEDEPVLAPAAAADMADGIERTDWGPAHRLTSPHRVEGAPAVWDLPARDLGWAEPRWGD